MMLMFDDRFLMKFTHHYNWKIENQTIEVQHARPHILDVVRRCRFSTGRGPICVCDESLFPRQNAASDLHQIAAGLDSLELAAIAGNDWKWSQESCSTGTNNAIFSLSHSQKEEFRFSENGRSSAALSTRQECALRTTRRSSWLCQTLQFTSSTIVTLWVNFHLINLENCIIHSRWKLIF